MYRVYIKESFVYGDGYSFGKGEQLISEAMGEMLRGNRNVVFLDDSTDDLGESNVPIKPAKQAKTRAIKR